jgi:hypothetical protein
VIGTVGRVLKRDLEARMTDDAGTPPPLRERLTRQGEDAIGRLAQDLLENPLVNGAIARAFEAREKATQAQEAALGALNIPTAADIERLTRRVRSVSQRLEGIEDALDRLDERLASAGLAGVEGRLEQIAAQLAAIQEQLPAAQPEPKAKPRAKAGAS